MSFYDELKRRNVIRVAAGYVVAAWLIIQVAETILPFYDVPDSAIRTLITVLVVLFIPVVVLAWVFEWTPQGIRKDADVDRGEPLGKANYRTFDRIVIVVLAVAVTYFAVDEFIIEAPPPSTGDYSIAVMPFADLSPDPDQACFAGGVTEEVRVLLGKIPQLRVTARGSITKVVEMGLDIAGTAEKLQVAHMLEGSVRRSGNRVRITAELVDASSGESVWSESYDETLDNIFDIQDEIAESIVDNLHVKLVGPLPKAERTDTRALVHLIQAKQVWYQQIVTGGWSGIGDQIDAHLDAALEIDPEYVEALSFRGLANYARVSAREITPEEYERREKQISDDVLAVDPDNGYADWIQLWQKFYREVDVVASIPIWEKVYVASQNDSERLRDVARFAVFFGRSDLAVPMYERAVALDPLNARALYQLSRGYIYARQWDKAEEARERFLSLGGRGGFYYYGMIKLMIGDAEQAYEVFSDPSMPQSYSLAGSAMALHALGKFEESDQALAALLEDWNDEKIMDIAVAHAVRNENDAAFEWLEKLLQKPPDPVSGRYEQVEAIANPFLANLHDDPRWEQYRMRVGLPTELIESIELSVDLRK